MAARRATPWRMLPTILPKVYVSEKPTLSRRTTDKKFVSPVGFSKGCAPLPLKKPPPFVPSCLMASMKPTGPTAMTWVILFKTSWMCTGPLRVCAAPWPTKMSPNTKAIGSSM